jgi:beta-phosphoglucomutase-like phosphatase (HAD superfamily)
MRSPQTAFLFDLDGTLVDSGYQHVLAWHEALEAEGIKLSIWRIQRAVHQYAPARDRASHRR